LFKIALARVRIFQDRKQLVDRIRIIELAFGNVRGDADIGNGYGHAIPHLDVHRAAPVLRTEALPLHSKIVAPEPLVLPELFIPGQLCRDRTGA